MLRKLCSAAMAFFRPDKVLCGPVHAQIEHTSFCNLSCPQCSRNDYVKTPRNMGLEDFKRILGRLSLDAITLNGLGEAVMNPELVPIISFAKGRGITINTTSNFTVIREEMFGPLVRSGLDLLNISVDAATPATYKHVRGGDLFDTVTRNIAKMVEIKKDLSSQLPLLRLCFVIQSANVHEMTAFYRMARELGADIVLYQIFGFFNGDSHTLVDKIDLKAVDSNLEAIIAEEKEKAGPATNARLLKKKMPLIVAHYNGRRTEAFRRCIMPWISVYISVEGEVRPCCVFAGTHYPVGNIFETADAGELFNNEKIRDFRRSLRKGAPPHKLCAQCLTDSFFDVLVSRFRG